MPPREYGEERTLAGWVQMTHPTLPDNEPINVLESAVPAKEHAGWVVVEEASTNSADNDAASSWELTNDED